MITDMTTFLLILMFAALIAALERNHRRRGPLSARPFDGEALSRDNRDVARIRQELSAMDADAGRRFV